MTAPVDAAILSPAEFDAFAFDLDGVVTDTARSHEKAWSRTFDDLLEARAKREGSAFVPFSSEDYRKYVDGRPRHEAIRISWPRAV